MRATTGLPRSIDGWTAEPKLDGWPARVAIHDGRITVRTRGGHDVGESVPHLHGLADVGLSIVLDGELVAGAGHAEGFYALAGALSRKYSPPGGARRSRWSGVVGSLLALVRHLGTEAGPRQMWQHESGFDAGSEQREPFATRAQHRQADVRGGAIVLVDVPRCHRRSAEDVDARSEHGQQPERVGGNVQRAGRPLPAATPSCPTGSVAVVLAPHRMGDLTPTAVRSVVEPRAAHLDDETHDGDRNAQRETVEGGNEETGEGDGDAEEHSGRSRLVSEHRRHAALLPDRRLRYSDTPIGRSGPLWHNCSCNAENRARLRSSIAVQ